MIYTEGMMRHVGYLALGTAIAAVIAGGTYAIHLGISALYGLYIVSEWFYTINRGLLLAVVLGLLYWLGRTMWPVYRDAYVHHILGPQ
jgi:hypothetical protein